MDRLDTGLRLAVGLGPVRTGAAKLDAEFISLLVEDPRAVVVTVVGEQTFDRDAGCEEGLSHPSEEARGGLAAFVRQGAST